MYYMYSAYFYNIKMNPLTENEWDNLRSNFIHGRLLGNLRTRFQDMFPNEEVISMIHFDELSPDQKEEAYRIYILNELGEIDGGRKHRKCKKYKRTRRRRSRKSRGRKSRRHR